MNRRTGDRRKKLDGAVIEGARSGAIVHIRRLQSYIERYAQLEQWMNPLGFRAVAAVFLVIAMIGICSGIVYWTGGTVFVWVQLMYVPIILAAASFKIPGGVLSAILAGLALGPFMPLYITSGPPPKLLLQDAQNWLIRLGIFLLFGTLVGFLFRWMKEQLAQLKESHRQLLQTHAELKNTQMLLIQKAKLESVGRLAAGVAHEVKNPLAIIQLGADFLQHELAGNVVHSETVRDISDAVQRADRVIRGLLDFSRSEKLALEPSDLNRVIDDSLLLVKHELAQHNIALQTDLAEALPPLLLDANKIKQVLINLCINAIQAMGNSGTLRVTTLLRQMTRDDLQTYFTSAEHVQPGESVVIAEISDSGPGIPSDKLHMLFDPFFTTKPVGVGTGLGLSISRKIVELHHAAIDIGNSKEGGARAVIMFRTPHP